MPMLTRLRTMPKPVIAAMNGPAVGIGASYALACDIRIATPEAYILEAFINIGLAPDGGVSWLLPRLAGTGGADEMFFTGKPLAAAGGYRVRGSDPPGPGGQRGAPGTRPTAPRRPHS